MALLVKNKWKIENETWEDASSSLLDAVLNARGYNLYAEKEGFLSPPLTMGNDPFLFRDMDLACDAIIDAIHSKERIVIYGDYDVDGITSTSMMVLFLKELGANVEFVIPDRILEGYGLTDFGVRKILDLEAQLVITVDCGIASIHEVQKLVENNIKVVVTDHHECKQIRPNATAVLNPKRPDSLYPFRDLAGAGVTLKLIQALCVRMDLNDLWESYIDLAAIGTVADVVLLCGENRMMVFHGLIRMNCSNNIGLISLLEAIDKSGKPITSTTIGYGIAPRINAAGRMGDSNRAVRLLTTSDNTEADNLANDLIADNKKRQEIETQIYETARERIALEFDFSINGIIVIYQKGWHQGVIGIVASRLVELFHRSVIIFGGEEGFYKGSARSSGNESILSAIEFAGEHVLQFGGHKKAAGLVVRDDCMEPFLKAIKAYSAQNPSDETEENTIRIDFEIPFGQITLSNACDIARIAPFGEGNLQPVFVCRNMVIEQIRFLSSGKHMKLVLDQSPNETVSDGCLNERTGQRIDAIAFGFSENQSMFAAGDRIDAVFSLEINEWNGNKSVQIIIKDIRKSTDEKETLFRSMEDYYQQHPDGIMAFIRKTAISSQEVIPQKSDFIAVYQYLKTNYSRQPVLCDLDILSVFISNNYKISLSVFKLARIFDIFMDVDVLRFTNLGRYRVKFQLLDVVKRASLTNSKTYQTLCTESVIL